MRISCLFLQVFVPQQWWWAGQAGLAGMHNTNVFVWFPQDTELPGSVDERLRHTQLVAPRRQPHVIQSGARSVLRHPDRATIIDRWRDRLRCDKTAYEDDERSSSDAGFPTPFRQGAHHVTER